MTRREAWKQLKETIIEIRDNNEFEHEDITLMCRFLVNYIDALEKQINLYDCLDGMTNGEALSGLFSNHWFSDGENYILLDSSGFCNVKIKKQWWDELYDVESKNE